MSKLFSAIAPIALSFLAPPLGTSLGAALGATTAAGQAALGGGILGAGTGLLGGGGLKSALLGGVTGGLGGYVQGSGGLGGALNNAGFGNIAYNLGEAGANGGILGNIANGISSLGSGAGGTSSYSSLLMPAANIYSGIQGADTAKYMAKAQLAGTDKAIAAAQPYLSSGLAANNQLSGLLGLGGEDKDDILELLRNSPGYQFRLSQGQDALDKGLAARGGFFSGNAMKETQALGQNMADQTYNDYVNQLYRSSAAGQDAANSIGGLYQSQGDIQANRLSSRSNSINQALAGLVNNRYGQSSTDELIKRLLGG